jgi:hypothetical protein
MLNLGQLAIQISGSGVAGKRACAASRDAGDRMAQQRIA